jgi:hypothetical protein
VGRKEWSKAISLGIVAVGLLASGCGGPPTIWKAEIPSPNGLWIASVRTIQHGGFGTASIDTVVYLQQASGAQPPTQILAFDCQGPAPRPYVLSDANAGGTIDLTVKWLSPSHLYVTYDKHPDLYFQVVRMAGIDISVRNLSSPDGQPQR